MERDPEMLWGGEDKMPKELKWTKCKKKTNQNPFLRKIPDRYRREVSSERRGGVRSWEQRWESIGKVQG